MNIIISPYSTELQERPNAKNYPYWRELTGLLRLDGHNVIQIGLPNEKPIGANGYLFSYKLFEVASVVRKFDIFMSVDNFLPHLMNVYHQDKKGIVLFSRSDPKIYGYEQNYNILKSRDYLRPDQYGLWKDCEFLAESWHTAPEMMVIINDIIAKMFAKTA
jgi:hypothetical protein